jgi:nitrite reductase/ring-hydroxylating ferredoxin subunit
VAFAHSVRECIFPVSIGARGFVLVSDQGTVRAFSAVCPHRGAHLAFGGRLKDGQIICPFHGYCIHLGDCFGEHFSVPEYPTMVVGGMVFVRLSQAQDNGWAEQARLLERDYWCVNGFEMIVKAPMDLVIENAFDRLHFRAVHGIRNETFQTQRGAHGALEVSSVFHIPKRDVARYDPKLTEPTKYHGIAFSPGLAMTELLGETHYRVITGATDMAEGGCVVRITVAFPRADFAAAPAPSFVEPLLQYFRRGLEQDRMMWENVSDVQLPHWMPEDDSVREFQRFCAGFAIEVNNSHTKTISNRKANIVECPV